MIFLRSRRVAPGELALAAALMPWEHQLAVESIGRWLIRGASAAFVLANLVLLVGWVVPRPEAELRPWAFELGLAAVAAAAIVALWPRKRLHRAGDLDTRLKFGDRLATAWTFRQSDEPIIRLQRADAIARLEKRNPPADLKWRPARAELVALGVVGLTFAFLLVARSPQQDVLERQAAEQYAVEQASQHLDALRAEAVTASGLTPEQVQQLDELLQRAQEDLNRTHSQLAATAVLARAQDQLAQMGDPNADLRDEALAAMSETLAAEPQTHALGAALQRADAQAASEAVKALAAQADQLSTIDRQSLSRALQRAANVGRADPRSASALRDAAQAIGSGNPSDAALSATDSALRDAIQASQAQASLNAAQQRLRDLQAQLASGKPLEPWRPRAEQSGTPGAGLGLAEGTPVALSSAGSRGIQDPQSAQGVGAGYGAAGGEAQASSVPAGQAAEIVFVPGRAGNGPADQDLVDQPFTLRGAPRPYRDVLSQYAQSSRDYVDRPDISPAVRDLVKQYFQSLEEGG